MRIPPVISLAVLLVVAAACQGQTQPDQEAETTTTTTTTTIPPPADPQTEEPEDADTTTTTDESDFGRVFVLDEPATFEENGLRLEITGIAFVSIEEALAEAEEFDRATLEAVLEEETRTLIYLEGRMANNAGATVSWHPSQGILQVGSEQRDANLFLAPDQIGGNDILDGTEDEGFVVFEFRGEPDELAEAGTARFIVSSAFDDDFNEVAGQADLTIEW